MGNIETNQNGQRKSRRSPMMLVSLLLAMTLVIGLAQIIAAAGDGTPTPKPTDDPGRDPSAYVDLLPTARELLEAEPGVERYVAGHSIPAELLSPADLDGSTKVVAPTMAPPGGQVQFTVTVNNSGDTDMLATVTDALPAGLTYVDHECVALLTTVCDEDGGTITWEGTAVAGQVAIVSITASVDGNVASGTDIVNTAVIDTAEESLERSATLEVREQMGSPIQFVPVTVFGLTPDPQPVVVSAGRVNGNNEWQVSWTDAPGSTAYEIQEAISPDFVGATSYLVADNELLIRQTPSFNNVFYYRARSFISNQASPWSNTVSVVGGYRDDFNDANSGWKMRRTTYLEEVRSFYETDRSWLVMQVEDRWDWGIASPGRPAPRLPYVIEFDVQPANLANLLTYGFAFGGDWPSTSGCPSDPNSFDGIYRHTDCFNHFYNTNTIYYGWQKLLFERVDRLEWCLQCGGSPMKRLGDIDSLSAKDLKGIDPEGWNTWRIEVRADGIKVYVAERGAPLQLQYEYDDTRWVNGPYFGVFASTDEYSNSTWRFDYVQVLPLDD